MDGNVLDLDKPSKACTCEFTEPVAPPDIRLAFCSTIPLTTSKGALGTSGN